MPDETYNGWTNRATWLMSMYLDGNYDGEGTYRDTRHMVAAARDDQDSFQLAETLESYVNDRVYDYDTTQLGGIVTDLLGYALGSVNWREIAESLLRMSHDR